MMDESNTAVMEDTLSCIEIHEKWWKTYLDAENQRFFERLYDTIVRAYPPAHGATLLDAGCGNGIHAIRLARRGFMVRGVDCSESAVEAAQTAVHRLGLCDQVQVERGNLLDLPFEDRQFDYVYCWGVLMHIPEIERALAELARVVKPGGVLIIGESNMFSAQSLARRGLRSLLGRTGMQRNRTPAGIEYWKETPYGRLMARETDMTWLVNTLERMGLKLDRRIAAQFTELYAKVPTRPLKKLVHGFNMLWFRYVRLPQLAFGNVLFLRRPA
jgi:2-polyprenyl-3-methyl-5-hydroxy-6-metoxy-1,4-benzoquinol methylase